MPIKKKRNSKAKVILIWTLIIALVILMIISFPATQHMTEIVVYP